MNAVRKLTGTTGGESPIFDGTMRGAIVGLLNAAIGLATVSKWVDAEQAIYFALMVNPFVFVVFGLWDSFWKVRTKHEVLEDTYRAIVENKIPPALSGQPTVGEALKKARLPEDKRITEPPKTTQARGAGGRFYKSGDSGTRPLPDPAKPIPGRPKTKRKKR